jgi:DNA-binding transcriptional MerR regulator
VSERLTIDELARTAGMTARNIRAHQSRGLLPPPDIEGRTGYYGREHVARLEVITGLQAAGFNLEAIKRLIEAAPSAAPDELLAFGRAILRPWESEGPRVYGAGELAEWFGGTVDPQVVARAVALGVIVPIDDGRYEVPSPTLLRAGADVAALGIPLERVLDVLEELTNHARGIARSFVSLFLEGVWQPFQRQGAPEDQWLQVHRTLERLRPLASEALMAAFNHLMTETVEEAFGRELERVAQDRAAG